MRTIFFNLLLFGTCGYALLKGARDARIVAAVCLVGVFATNALRGPAATSYASVQTGVMAVDILVFVAFSFVALTSDRFWPLWVSGLQLTTTMGHVLKGYQTDLRPIAYAAALRFWVYPILVILAAAVWRHQRRARRQEIRGSA